MTYKMLAGKDILPLIVRMLEDGEPMPNILLPTVGFVAEDENGKIVAYTLLQTLPVIEPMKAEPGHGECLKELFAMMKKYVLESNPPRVIMHTHHRAMELMLLREDGVEIIPDKFFQWLRPESVLPFKGTTADMVGV